MRIGRRGFLGAGAAAALKAAGARRHAGSIDCHTHWTPEPYLKAQAQARGTGAGGGGTPDPLDYDLEKRIAWMNDRGVQMHVLTLSGQMPWQWAAPDAGAHLAQIVNDAAAEAHAKYPER